MQSLVDQLPETDKEIQLRKDADQQAAKPPPAPGEKPAEKPKPDRWGAASKFTGPDPAVADRLFEQALTRGRDGLVELVGLVRDPASADFKNYKPEYFLHGLAIYVTAPGREAQRKTLVNVLAAQLPAARGEVRSFLVRELRLIGDADAVAAVAKAMHDESLCADAVAALLSIGESGTGSLRSALPAATGKCRLQLAQALGAARDQASLPALTQALGDPEMDVRLAAAWALARIGDPASAKGLLKAADVRGTWERVKATQACLLLAENLAKAGNRAASAAIYAHLRDTRTDPGEAYIRDLATKALGTLGIG